MKIFYTYLWLREDGTPYYVGKGHGRRAFRSGSPTLDKILIQEFPSEEYAFIAEKFLISYYGRKDIETGILRNLTEGGEGFVGGRHTKENKERFRKKSLGHFVSEEARSKIRIGLTGNSHRLGQKSTLEHCSKIRKALLGNRNGAANKGRVFSAETIRKMSESAKNRKIRTNLGVA